MIGSIRAGVSGMRFVGAIVLLAACSGTTPTESTAEGSPSTSSSTVAPATLVPTTAPPQTAIITTMTTTNRPESLVHVFPLDPPEIGDYSPGGHSYPATDIFAPIGTRFVAVTSGTIQGVSLTDTWDPELNDGATRGGLSVSLIGDDGVRYYGSHLSAVADGIVGGARVEAGELLGLVGVSGNARDTPPHLHFGVSRPTALDDWEVRRGEIDPVPFLDAWRAGDNAATPEV